LESIITSGYLNYDYVLTWSDEISGYFSRHHQKVKSYENIGCLWAGHIFGIIGGEVKTDIKEKLHKAGFKDDHKLIAVFDSTYLDNSLTTYEDGINFIEGIYRLLEEMPGIFIIFKEKKARWFIGKHSKEMLDLFDKLQSHPRCYLSFNKISTSEAMAYSDLTISFPFTSTTFEALSAKKKALYYDASDKFRDTYYDKVPGLVCHSYDELRKRAGELLYNIKGEEYEAYLNKDIKNRIDSYLDGKAISRFRTLLIS
jgi:polysaccharide biosynthesis PFTS motif protein